MSFQPLTLPIELLPASYFDISINKKKLWLCKDGCYFCKVENFVITLQQERKLEIERCNKILTTAYSIIEYKTRVANNLRKKIQLDGQFRKHNDIQMFCNLSDDLVLCSEQLDKVHNEIKKLTINANQKYYNGLRQICPIFASMVEEEEK